MALVPPFGERCAHGERWHSRTARMAVARVCRGRTVARVVLVNVFMFRLLYPYGGGCAKFAEEWQFPGFEAVATRTQGLTRLGKRDCEFGRDAPLLSWGTVKKPGFLGEAGLRRWQRLAGG
jgi:hypothetical protein